jgi:tetratricopeptide (TPR) repeat protein
MLRCGLLACYRIAPSNTEFLSCCYEFIGPMARKSKETEAANGGDPNARYPVTSEGQAKARKWFQRALELGEKRQYDYAIEYYVNGLEFWPDAVEEALKPLHGCGVARHQSGGSKPGFKDTMKRSMNDKNPMQAFLNSLWLFGHDPDNLSYVEGIVRNAGRLRAEDAAMWAGGVCFRAIESSSKSGAKQFQFLAKQMEELGDRAAARGEHEFCLAAYQKGIDTYRVWLRRTPKNRDVENQLRDLSTKLTITRGKYQDSATFADSIRDTDAQRELQDRDRSVQSEDRLGELIEAAREKYEADPDQPEAVKNYVDLLRRRERDDEERVAIGVLVEAFKKTRAYRWKQLADDTRMKQLARQERNAKKAGDEQTARSIREKRLGYELRVFKERHERYPTDLRTRFEYGVRLYNAGQYDAAIPQFQGARTDPKSRYWCGLYLGRCFYEKNYHSQAIEILQETMDAYEFEDDELGKNLAYWCGRSYEAAGNIAEARKTYGKLLQVDYNFRDVRDRMDKLPSAS